HACSTRRSSDLRMAVAVEFRSHGPRGTVGGDGLLRDPPGADAAEGKPGSRDRPRLRVVRVAFLRAYIRAVLRARSASRGAQCDPRAASGDFVSAASPVRISRRMDCGACARVLGLACAAALRLGTYA